MIKVYFDGACILREKGGWGYCIYKDDNYIMQDYGSIVDKNATSNQAEHKALCEALKKLKEMNLKDEKIIIFGDSKLVISQIFRNWKIRDFSLPYVEFCLKNKELIKEFSNIKGKLIPRKLNEEADRLSKLGLNS